MSIVIASNGPAGAFIAVDRRTSWAGYGDIPSRSEDLGGKIVSTGTGWAAASGTANAATAVLRALRDRSNGHPIADPVVRSGRLVRDALTEGGFDLEPGRTLDPVAGLDGVMAVTIEPWEGGGALVYYENAERGDRATTLVSLPFVSEDTEAEFGDRVHEALKPRDLTLSEAIATAAEHMAWAADHSESVSEEIEVGFLWPRPVDGEVVIFHGFLAGRSAAIAGEPSPMLFSEFSAHAPTYVVGEAATEECEPPSIIAPGAGWRPSRIVHAHAELRVEART